MANISVGHPTCESGWTSPLRTLRRRYRWSLSQAAARARMDQSHLSKVERGLAGLSVETLARLADAYDLSDLARELAPFVRDCQ
ncbi:helix-turn-helix transcriptional regulator [Streptacidiphilus sp. PB12-B1b]|uniref:helix-turn-helix domain-containing protein n=1 Tax=Streptacidiphilus sp. PB12-B1b TaxID=2705012 RepID=UPI0015FC5F47|nr:helix-turn-helix transcriptional regulator [Streptacidiphilus sp. PB12-B1b]